MRLPTEFIRLPLRFDARRLAAEVERIEEGSWRPHPQGHPGNSALPLIAAGGDPLNDAARGPMRPTPHLARLPYLRQVLASFESVLGRTRLMRLDGNAEATAHSDVNYYWMQRVRIHVPVVTWPEVRFLCGEREVHMAAGEAWIFDTWKVHNVLNPRPTRRIHLVIDTVGSAAFWELVERSIQREEGEEPRSVPFRPDEDPEIATETVNAPVVMSPWEQEALLAPLVAEVAEDRLKGIAESFRRDWRDLWSRWGETPGGWPAYRALLDRFSEGLTPFEGLRLANGVRVVEAIRHAVVVPGVNAELAASPPPGPHPLAPAPATPPALPGRGGSLPRSLEGSGEGGGAPLPGRVRGVAGEGSGVRAPVFIVASPRSGTSLLFETLAQSPDLWTIGGESHGLIEGIEELHPASRDWESNRLTAADARPETVRLLEERFLEAVHDRDGKRPDAWERGLRLLEKTPKNSLRVPFLAAAFPDALFVYLYRDPREIISSMLDAWKSGRFVTYPELPGWPGPLPWSHLLVPGWRELGGRPLAEIVARQWRTAIGVLLDDLEALPADRWCVVSYDRLVTEPAAEIGRLCDIAGLAWDRELTAPLPLSRHTLTSPEPDKWRHNAAELDPVMPLVTAVAERAREIFARPPARRPVRRSAAEAPRVATGATAAAPAGNPEAFRSSYTAGFPGLLRELGISLLVSTYQSGRLIAVRADGDRLNTHFRAFPSPMGIALGPRFLAIGTQRHVWEYRNQREVGLKLDPPGRHDAVFLPRGCHVTGDVRVHELVFAGEELWVANTRFSCLATLDREHSFVPRWRPPFVTALSPDDRCHLNGVAVADGRVRWVTALGATDTPRGWREEKAHGGVLIDVPSGEIVARGLSMPHSPRWAGGRLWVLESGKGGVATIEPATGRVETMTDLPGFTRGLAFAGAYAFVGLSQVRESNVFGGIPLSERVKERLCGVWALDLRTGRVAGFLRFEGLVQEIFDVQVLPGIRWPEIAEPDSDLIARSFVLPNTALRYD